MTKRRKIPPPEPAPAASRITEWLVRVVVLGVVVACCGRLWLVFEAILKRRYISVIRGRPARVFYADSDPQRFWISIGWDALLTGVLLALIAWYAYAGWKARPRRRR